MDVLRSVNSDHRGRVATTRECKIYFKIGLVDPMFTLFLGKLFVVENHSRRLHDSNTKPEFNHTSWKLGHETPHFRSNCCTMLSTLPIGWNMSVEGIQRLTNCGRCDIILALRRWHSMVAALNQCPPTQYVAFCMRSKNLRSLLGIPYARKACHHLEITKSGLGKHHTKLE